MGVLLDSVILIDHFNGIQAATDYVDKNADSAAVSVITRAEVLVGFPPPVPVYVSALLDSFPLLKIGREIADLAAQLRRKHRWKLPDAFQAALAQHHGYQLATRNTDDFDEDKHGFVVNPYRL